MYMSINNVFTMEKTSRKLLIVNADDFGMSRGISDGIMRAHTHGIVTSTSLMVTMPAAHYAANLCFSHRRLSVGLHGDLPTGGTVEQCVEELECQYYRFLAIVGHVPSHFDLHGAIPTTPHMAFAARCFIEKHQLFCRGMDNSRVISSFYGMKNGKIMSKNISSVALSDILSLLSVGLNILVCHPGVTSNRLRDPYKIARNMELCTLTSHTIHSVIKHNGIRLINFTQRR